MNKYIYVNPNLNSKREKNEIFEGGASRNMAMMKYISKNIVKTKQIFLDENVLLNTFKVFKVLLMSRKNKILFQYTTIGIPIFSKNIIGKLLTQCFLFLLSMSANKNNIIFDISDLKYEQSIDLQVNVTRRQSVKKFELKFFSKKNLKFIFASNSMREYACKKYDIFESNTEVCMNGGYIYIDKNQAIQYENMYKDKIVFVYAGTLNRGRQIEEMVLSFPNVQDKLLILIGENGDWIKDLEKNSNIQYLGKKTENEAKKIVSNCHVGLIPYNSNKLYYNLAYPTKLSFYITAGITFLSTPVQEVVKVKNHYNIGYIEKMTDWNHFISKISNKDILLNKSKIAQYKHDFEWDTIFKQSHFLNKS